MHTFGPKPHLLTKYHIGRAYIVYCIWPLLTFDLHEGDHYPKLASRSSDQVIDIEYNKSLDRRRTCFEDELNGGSNNIVQSSERNSYRRSPFTLGHHLPTPVGAESEAW